MTVRRNRFQSVPPGYFSATKGHSSLKRWYPSSYRASSYYDDTYYPEPILRSRGYYDTTREENEIRRDVNSELLYTSNLVDDTYDLAAKSRNRDQMLLREATRALPSTKQENKDTGKRTASLIPARRFQTPLPSLYPRNPLPYPKLTPPMYRATTNIQPLGILTKLDWTSPLRKYEMGASLHELENGDDASEYSTYATRTETESARSSPEREYGDTLTRYSRKTRPRRRIRTVYRPMPRRTPKAVKNVKYYPYLDTESVGSDDIGTVNGEYIDDDYQSTCYSEAGDGGEYYYVDRERSPSPIEYVPFAPRHKINLDDDEYKCQVPSVAEMAVSHFVPPRNDDDLDHDKSRIKSDILFHDVVSQTASKARDALKNVNLDEYDSASLVISVEGEYKDPVRGENMGFQYIARPLALKGPMLAGPAVYASTASDSAFNRYMDDMRSFRAQIRNRLESGYKTLSSVSSKVKDYSYPILASSHRSYSRAALSPPRSSSARRSVSPVRVPQTSYSVQSLPVSNLRKRLEEIESRYKTMGYGKRLDDIPDRLVVYPISEKSSIKPMTATENLPGHTKTLDLFEGSAKGNELSTLEKINIKVDTETYTSPRSAVTSRRVRQASVVRTPAPTSRAVSCPPVSRGSSQAALVGNKVEVVTPRKRKPRSTYAANKMRELKRDEREMEVEAVPMQNTTSLKASTVSPNYTGGKMHWDEDGKVTQPTNLLSWQYRIESRVPPGDYLFPVKTIGHVRDKLLHVKEQMDRHRQLMDRYLPNEVDTKTDVKTKIMNMYVDMEQHNPAS